MMPSSPDIEFTQDRRVWEYGTHADVTVPRFRSPDLTFSEVNQVPQTTILSEIAYLRTAKARAQGISNPRIVAFARLERDRFVADALPGANSETDNGEWLFSANSVLAYTLRALLSRGWLRFDGDEWSPSIPANQPHWQIRAREILRLLTRDSRLLVGSDLGRRDPTGAHFAEFDTRRDLLPVDKLGDLREFFWQYRPRVAFNAAFFLLEHEDFFSHHSGLGEAYNVHVQDGAMLRPPLYRRAAFYQTAGRPNVFQ